MYKDVLKPWNYVKVVSIVYLFLGPSVRCKANALLRTLTHERIWTHLAHFFRKIDARTNCRRAIIAVLLWGWFWRVLPVRQASCPWTRLLNWSCSARQTMRHLVASQLRDPHGQENIPCSIWIVGLVWNGKKCLPHFMIYTLWLLDNKRVKCTLFMFLWIWMY